MTDWREELIEKMANAMLSSKGKNEYHTMMDMTRAALAVAEPAIREQADNALREENARLREVLKPFEKAAEYCEGLDDLDYKSVLVGNLRAAAAAIREGGKDE